MDSGVVRGLNMICEMGSPGAESIMKNDKQVMPKKVGIACNNRLRM